MNRTEHKAESESIIHAVMRRSIANEGLSERHKDVMAEHAHIHNNLLLGLIHATLANIPDPITYDNPALSDWSNQVLGPFNSKTMP